MPSHDLMKSVLGRKFEICQDFARLPPFKYPVQGGRWMVHETSDMSCAGVPFGFSQ
jgi:hypothetical protein